MIDLGAIPKGMTIEDAARKAKATLLAIHEIWDTGPGARAVTFTFNGEVVTVFPAYDAETVVDHYKQRIDKREMVAR